MPRKIVPPYPAIVLALFGAVWIPLLLSAGCHKAKQQTTPTAAESPKPATSRGFVRVVSSSPAPGPVPGQVVVVENITLTDADLDKKIALSQSEADYWKGVRSKRSEARQQAEAAQEKAKKEAAAREAEKQKRRRARISELEAALAAEKAKG